MSNPLPAALRDLSVPVPPGRTVTAEKGDPDTPVLWLTDAPATGSLWSRLRAAHQGSGLWPVLLDHLDGDGGRPWDDGELWPEDCTDPAGHDPGGWLAVKWADYTSTGEDDDMLSDAERVGVTAPFGQRWPGLADRCRLRVPPDPHADACAEELLRAQPHLRLGLVPADRSADVPAVVGWEGAANFETDAGKLSAVLRSWEDRFGVRVIGLGFAELYVSVAAPPATMDQALRVAAEHFAFCPDNVWQERRPFTLAGYAARLVDSPLWTFWWD